MEDIEYIVTTPGEADTAPEGARKINANFDRLVAALPTKVSDLTNDLAYLSLTGALQYFYLKNQTYTREEINQKIAAIKTASFEVVDALPASGEENIIYLVPKVGGEVPDTHDEYIWVDSAWELIGSTQIDLSNYLQKTGDASDTTVTFVSEAGDPTSGSKLSSLIGRIVKKLSDMVSGAIAVAKAASADTATKATQDGDGNNISSTYLKRSGGQMEGMLSLRMYSGTNPGGELSFFGNNEKDSNGALLYGITSFGSSTPASIRGTWIQSYIGLHFVGAGKTLTINGNGVAAEKFIGNLQGNATNDGDGNKISDTYLKRSGGTMTGNLGLSNEGHVNGAVGNLIGRFTWAGGLKAVVGNSQDTLALLSKDAATLNGSPIFTRAGGLVSGTLVQKKGNCSIHTDVASYRMPDNHTGWVRIDFGLLGAELLGVIDMIVYGKGGISIDFSGYTYVSSSNPTANNWYGPKYGIRGSVDAPMPTVRFAKDNTTGRRYIMIGGDGFAWGPYGFISLSKIVLGSLGNTTGDLGISIEAVSGNYADLGLTNASVSNPSVSIEVERARQDGNGKDIPSTYATKEEVSSLSIGGENYITGLKDNWVAGYVNQTNGTVTTPDNYNVVTKDYQDISPLAGKRATISASDAPIEITGSTYYFSLRYAFYDTDKNFISGGVTDGKTPSIVSMDVPATAAYIKVSAGVGKYAHAFNNFESIRLKLELGDYATDYSLAPQDIPTVNDLPDVYVDTVPTSPKDGDILITTTD